MSKKKKDILDGYKMIPYYTFKKGDLVKVKEFARIHQGMLGVIVSREDYNTACKVLFSDGTIRTLMKFTLERISNDDE